MFLLHFGYSEGKLFAQVQLFFFAITLCIDGNHSFLKQGNTSCYQVAQIRLLKGDYHKVGIALILLALIVQLSTVPFYHKLFEIKYKR